MAEADDLDMLLTNALKRASPDQFLAAVDRVMKKQKLSPEEQKSKAMFGTPPSSMNASIFAIKYGLIRVSYDRTPLYDKFERQELSPAVLLAVHILVCASMINSVKARGNPGGEAKRQGLHELLLTSLRGFTSPKTKAVYNESDYDGSDGSDSEAGSGDEPPAGAAAEEKEVLLAPEALQASHDEGMDDTDFETDTKDFMLDHPVEDVEEGDDEEEETASATTASNRSLVVDDQLHNEEERKSRQHSDVLAKVYRDDRLELKLGVDFKSTADWKNLFQPAAYVIGSLSLTSGLGAEYRPPVCLQAWDKSTWYYGYLDIDEFVEVESEEIVQNTLARFPLKREDALASTDAKVKTWPFTQQHVRRKFGKWKKELKRQGMKIPDGRYPVGKMFINQQSNLLPNFSGDYKLSGGARRFYEGMLKTLVGRKVTKWTSRHVYKAFYRRKDLLEAAIDMGLPKDQWQYVPGLAGELNCETWA